jgi:superfamily II DNA/RNA helicase
MDSITDFKGLALPAPIQASLDLMGISEPTPIQAQAIPIAMNGGDLIGLAQTGTGKTFAFCLPMIVGLDKPEHKDSCALILTPTREIAIQVSEVLKQLTSKMTGRWKPVLVIGGVGMRPQEEGLRRQPRIIVSTPGRLVDHIRNGVARLSNVRFLVLDEADRMLDMGFAPQLREVLNELPKERQTLLFSATFPKGIEELSQKYLTNPARIEVGGGHSQPIESVEQLAREINETDKYNELIEVLREREGTAIVFMRTKHRTKRLAEKLMRQGIAADCIHGDRSQNQRQATLAAFKEGRVRVLVATDIAARGIDVPNVGFVLNYDIPNVPEEYIHRIGRTGRAGATGVAISFVTAEDASEWRAIQRLINPETRDQVERPAARRPQQQQQQRSRRPQQQRGGAVSKTAKRNHFKRGAGPKKP